MIDISINGKIEKLEENLNIKEMLVVLNYTTKTFAVAINTTFVAIKEYENTLIKKGDTIDILAPIQGG